MGNERLYPSIYGSIALRQKQIMASIAASSSSTPRPERGQLWRHRRNGVYAVVIGINGPNGSVRAISRFGEISQGVDQFIELYTKVGEFDGSKWRDTFNTWGGTPIVTVSLTPSNTVRIVRGSTGDIIMQSYGVKEFLDITTFQSAGPASAGSGGPASIAHSNLQGYLDSNFSETHTGWRVRFSFRDTPLEARSALKSYLDGWMGDWKWHSRSESIQTDGMEGLYDGRRLDPATFTNRMMAPPNSTRVRVLTNGPDGQDPSTYFRWFLFWIPKRWSYPTRFIDIFINMLSRRFSEFPSSDISERYDNRNSLVSMSFGRDSSLAGPGSGASTETAIEMSGAGAGGPARSRPTAGYADFNELFGSDSDNEPNVKKRKRATSSSSSPGTRMPDDLRNAISNGTAEEVKELLAKGYDVNAIYEDGPQTVLWLALFNRNVEMVKLLLACGADVNPKLRDVNLRRGATYLLLLLAVEDPAGTGELMEMFKLLLEAGANINATYERRTMLQLAKEKGKFDFLVEMLKYSERKTTTCAICMDSLGVAPTLIVKLACGHMFHRACLSAWTGSNSTCPECRRRIDPSELQGQGEIFIFTGNDADGNVVYKLRQELKF